MGTRFLAALMFLAFTGHATQAQAPRRTNLSYEAYYTPEARNNLAPSLIPLKFDGRFEVWYLLGEPVVNCTARWLNNHQLRVNTPGGDTIIAEPGETEVYNLMLVAQLADPGADNKPMGQRGGHIAVFCDAGIVAQNGQNGFNVAGSPNWDKFLCSLRTKFNIVETGVAQYDHKQEDLCLSIGGTWMAPDAAKKLAREGLNFKDVRIRSLEVNAGNAIRRYEKLMWRKKSFVYKQNKATALDRTYSQRANGGVTVYGGKIGQFRGKASNPTAADLKAYDALISEIQGKLQDGGASAAQWREKDQALVREQLAHVRAIEPNILREDAKLAEYQKALENSKATEPVPDDLLAKYATTESLEIYQDRWDGPKGARTKSGQIVLLPRSENIFQLEGSSGQLYDLYVVFETEWSNKSIRSYIVDGTGKQVGDNLPMGYLQDPRKFLEGTDGLLVFLSDGWQREAFPIVYSIPEGKVIFDGKTANIPSEYMNNDSMTLYRYGQRRMVVHDRKAKALARARTISGRHVAYRVHSDGYIENYVAECEINGKKEGLWPLIMYDLQQQRLLKKSEFLCVPIPDE